MKHQCKVKRMPNIRPWSPNVSREGALGVREDNRLLQTNWSKVASWFTSKGDDHGVNENRVV